MTQQGVNGASRPTTGRITITESATRHLDAWADKVQRGELHISQLPPAVQQFIYIGLAWADEHLRALTDEYEHKLDLAYIQAHHPKERAEIYQQRLDNHFRLEEQRFFAVEEESFNEPTIGNIAA